MPLGDRKRDLGTFSDVLLAVLAYLLVLDGRLGGMRVGDDGLWYVLLIPIIVGTWWLLSVNLRHDVPYRLPSVTVEIRETVLLNVVGGGIVVALTLLAKQVETSRLVLVAFPVVAALLTIVLRLLVRSLLVAWRRSGRDARHMLVVGPLEASRQFAAAVATPESGLRPIGMLVPPVPGAADGAAPEADGGVRGAPPVLGDYPQLEEILHSRVVDQIAVTAPLDDPGLRRVVETATREGKSVWLMLDAFGSRLIGSGRPQQIVVLSRERGDGSLWLKRALDVLLAGLCLLAASPVLAACALAIKLDDPSAPVIFRQRRVGLNGREFTCLKFRSMVPDAEARRAALLALNEMDGPVFKIEKDPRITSVGRVLRKYSLDELPQLWNVLLGDMSLVGPRPPLPAEVREYQPEFRRRLAFRPGLTCLWQVSGRNSVDFQSWMALDLQYVDNWSLLLDLQILLRTIPVVLFGSGM